MESEKFYRMLADLPELKCPECGHDTQPVMRAVLEIRRANCLKCGAPLRFLEWRDYGAKQESLYRRGLLPGFPQPNVHWSLGDPRGIRCGQSETQMILDSKKMALIFIST